MAQALASEGFYRHRWDNRENENQAHCVRFLRRRHPLLDGSGMERPFCLRENATHASLDCFADWFSLIFCYCIKNENPSNRYSCFPSLATGFTSPRRTCWIATTTFGR